MKNFIKTGKITVYLFAMLFVLGLYVTPHTREGDTVFAFNLHNLGKVFERVILLPEERDGPLGLIGKDIQKPGKRAF